MRRGGIFLKQFVIVFTLLGMLISSSAHAADAPKNKGLLISPLQQFVNINAGATKTLAFTVANLTESPLTVTLSVEQFSVSDYAYNYKFSSANDWLKITPESVTLAPNDSKSVSYAIAVPKDAPAGGQYYTLFASAHISDAGLDSTVQATTLVYLTVNGDLVQTSELVKGSIQHLVFGNRITYRIDAKNTGNVHYFAYFSGKLKGATTRNAPGASHLLLPGPIREVEGTIPSPLLPGVYKADYGYKTDVGKTVSLSGYIIFIPPWSLALLAIIALGIIQYRQRRLHRSTAPDDETTKV